jgi:uncharacterized membrane protein (DUF4010 family)
MYTLQEARSRTTPAGAGLQPICRRGGGLLGSVRLDSRGYARGVDTLDLFEGLGLALAIGLLVGLERGWREREGASGSRVAGIRTYALIGLLGGVWGAMWPVLGPWPVAAAGLAFAGAFTLFQWREVAARNEFSVTSTVAGLLVFGLGVYAVIGDRTVAAGAGVVTMALLAARTNLHEFLKRLTWPELRSAVLLLAMTFVLLPLLPDRMIDPWDSFNPHQLWLLTVLIAAVSFAGYAAIRIMGTRRGVMLSAVAGALVSSTSVTITNSHMAKENAGGPTTLFAAAICASWMMSLARMTTIACVLNFALFQPLIYPILVALGILAVAVAVFFRRTDGEKARVKPDFKNPLDLTFVLRFGGLLAVVLVGANILNRSFGSAGLLGLAGVSGFADVDPITISAATLAGVTVTPQRAAESILLAATANMVTKIVIPIGVGGVRFGFKPALAGVLAVVAGGATLVLMGV